MADRLPAGAVLVEDRSAGRPQVPWAGDKLPAGATPVDEQSPQIPHESTAGMGPIQAPARIALGGLEEGSAGMIGLPQAITQRQVGGEDEIQMKIKKLTEDAKQTLGVEELPPDVAARLEAMVRRTSKAERGPWLGEGVQQFGQEHMLSSEEALRGMVNQTAPIADPQEMSGRYLQSISRMIPAAVPSVLAPETIPLTLASTATAGAAGQTARELGAPESVATLAEVAGGGVPGLLESPLREAASTAASAGRLAVQGPATRQVRQLVSALDLTPGQRAAAAAIKSDADRMNVAMSWPMAISEATGGGGQALRDLQRYLEATPAGSRELEQYFAGTFERARGQLGQEAANIGTTPGQPVQPLTGQARTDVPHDLQAAAQQAGQADVAGVRAQTRPRYQAAAADTVPPEAMNDVLTRLDTAIANAGTEQQRATLQRFRNDIIAEPAQAAVPPTRQARPMQPGQVKPIYETTPGTPAVPEQPKLDIQRLDSLRKTWRDRIELPDPAINADAIDKETAAIIGPLLGDLRTNMEASSAPYAEARQLHQTGMEQVIEPGQRSPRGQVAQAQPDMSAQADILLPRVPRAESADALEQSVRDMQAQDPQVVQRWLRTHIEGESQAFAQGPKGAQNPYVFFKVLAGSPEQQNMLRAAITATPGGVQKWQRVEDMLRVFKAHGWRQDVGSRTEFNRLMTEKLGEGPLTRAADVVAAPWTVPSIVTSGKVPFRQKLSELTRNMKNRNLSNVIMDSNNEGIFAQLHQMNPDSPNAERLLLGLLTGGGGAAIGANAPQP